jgi:hypothetical protein
LKKPNTIITSKGLLRQVPTSSSQKGIYLSGTLLQMIESGTFCGVTQATNFRKLALPPTIINNKYLPKNCLELLQFTLTPEQYQQLATPYNQKEYKFWYQLTKELEKQVLDKMCVLEGGDPETDRANSKKKTGPTKMPTVVALGNRINSYKQKIWDGLMPSERPTSKNECKLCERDQIRGPGTPKDNTSVLQFFKPKPSTTTTTRSTPPPVAEAIAVSNQVEDDEEDVVFVNVDATPQRLSFE